MAEQTTLDSLLEMGFDRNRAEKAVAHTGNQGIERAMDWLMEHEGDPDIDEPYVPPVGNVLGGTGGSDQQLPSPAAQPTEEGADPATDGGDQMIHDGDTKQPMTEEEKREQIKRLEELMRVKQEERRERERAEEVDREKQRRRQGQELLQVKQKLQEDEMKKMVDLRRREKNDDKMRVERTNPSYTSLLQFGGGSSSRAVTSPSAEAPPSSPPSQGPPPAKKDYNECRCLWPSSHSVRMLDGSALTSVFKAQEPLAAVRVYIQMNGDAPEGQDFTLLSPYPRRVYTELDMEKPLQELGLVPSAVLVVAKK
uniref:UBX domain protein 1 n=1 Tax=Hucho hucho TaxID=62062 RepID=A0A4W5NH87_9TELE